MKVRIKYGRERAEEKERKKQGLVQKASTEHSRDLAELICALGELNHICCESRKAGGNVWYEVVVYVHHAGIEFQVQRHGTVVGADFCSAPFLSPVFLSYVFFSAFLK